MCTFWPPLFYTTLGGAEEPTVSALRSSYNMFWWVWILLGWMPSLIMFLDFDKKYGNGYDLKFEGKGGKTLNFLNSHLLKNLCLKAEDSKPRIS